MWEAVATKKFISSSCAGFSRLVKAETTSLVGSPWWGHPSEGLPSNVVELVFCDDFDIPLHFNKRSEVKMTFFYIFDYIIITQY